VLTLSTISTSLKNTKTLWLLLTASIAAVAVAAAACGGGGSPTPSQDTGDAGYRGMVLADPLPKPSFTLTDTEGKPFDFFKETDGYITILYFGYTNCPDICPTHMANIASALHDLPASEASRVKVVFVSVDPERDTPDRMRAWLDLFDESFIGLRGDLAEVDAIQRSALGPLAFDIEHQPLENGGYLVSHSAAVLVYTTDNLAHLVYPSGFYKEDWVHDLSKLVTNGWEET
jgi:protein SCO1/2